MAAEVCVLITYSAHGSRVLQDAGLWEQSDWLARSVWPFDWG